MPQLESHIVLNEVALYGPNWRELIPEGYTAHLGIVQDMDRYLDVIGKIHTYQKMPYYVPFVALVLTPHPFPITEFQFTRTIFRAREIECGEWYTYQLTDPVPMLHDKFNTRIVAFPLDYNKTTRKIHDPHR